MARTSRGDAAATRTVRVQRGGVLMDVETPVVESRLIPNFREPSTDTPGLVLVDDGTVYLILPDGSRTPLDGGSGLPDWVTADDAGHFLTVVPNGDSPPAGGYAISTDAGDTNLVALTADHGLQIFPPAGFAHELIQAGTADETLFYVDIDGNVAANNLPGIAEIGVFGDTDAIYGSRAVRIPIPVDPIGNTYGGFNDELAYPPFAFTAAQNVLRFDGNVATVERVDTRGDDYNLNVAIFVSNADGTESMTLTGGSSADSGIRDDGAAIIPADLTVGQVGADLSYDPDTGAITTAAGGTYASMLTVGGGWD